MENPYHYLQNNCIAVCGRNINKSDTRADFEFFYAFKKLQYNYFLTKAMGVPGLSSIFKNDLFIL